MADPSVALIIKDFNEALNLKDFRWVHFIGV